MKKLIIITLIFISGCGKIDQLKANYSGQPTEVCIENINYLQFTSGATVKYNKEGKISLCK